MPSTALLAFALLAPTAHAQLTLTNEPTTTYAAYHYEHRRIGYNITLGMTLTPVGEMVGSASAVFADIAGSDAGDYMGVPAAALTGAMAASWDASTSTLSIAGDDTAANYELAVAAVQFYPGGVTEGWQSLHKWGVPCAAGATEGTGCKDRALMLTVTATEAAPATGTVSFTRPIAVRAVGGPLVFTDSKPGHLTDAIEPRFVRYGA